MLMTVLKIILLYMSYVFIKNAIKGYLTFKHIKNQAEQQAAAQKTQKTSQCSSDVFEAEYRVVRDTER